MRLLVNNRACLALALLGAATLMTNKASAGYGLHPAFHGGCDAGHVIDLLARHGCRTPLLQPQQTIVNSPLGTVLMPSAEYGDLVIDSVVECLADPDCPPAFLITIKNCSPRPVCNIQVSLVAMLGPIRPLDPTAVATLAEIPAGGCAEIKIVLPPAALRMGANGGLAVGFQQLLVAIDSLDQFAELDEANNIQLLNRCDIPKQEVVVEQAEVTETTIEAPAATLPAPEVVPSTSQPLDRALEEFGLDGALNQAAAQRL